MAAGLPPSVVFLNSEGTEADFHEFWSKDPIGAAQYAAALARAQQTPFEGLDEMIAVIDSDEPIEEQQRRLRDLAEKKSSVFLFVEKAETALQAPRGSSLGWSAGAADRDRSADKPVDSGNDAAPKPVGTPEKDRS